MSVTSTARLSRPPLVRVRNAGACLLAAHITAGPASGHVDIVTRSEGSRRQPLAPRSSGAAAAGAGAARGACPPAARSAAGPAGVLRPPQSPARCPQRRRRRRPHRCRAPWLARQLPPSPQPPPPSAPRQTVSATWNGALRAVSACAGSLHHACMYAIHRMKWPIAEVYLAMAELESGV